MCGKSLLPVVLLGVGLLSLAAVAVPAADDKTDSKKSSPADAKTIDKLIEQLGSDAFEDREKATKALDEIGAPALEALRKAAQSKDAEVKKRATELAGRIERRANSERVLK